METNQVRSDKKRQRVPGRTLSPAERIKPEDIAQVLHVLPLNPDSTKVPVPGQVRSADRLSERKRKAI
jgi:hypothetical protein